ncbi:MAG: hypothetical protein HGA45_21120 [Chloroflexales bacterium]|nr:hypothetical protein [Chloroflexales bacterium]
MALPDYLVARVQRPPPADSCIVSGSTPVVAFGNARTAAVATLGLNPSRVEFLDRAGNELPEPRRRLETLRSLAITGLLDAPEAAVAQVIAGCDAYFQRNPTGVVPPPRGAPGAPGGLLRRRHCLPPRPRPVVYRPHLG